MDTLTQQLIETFSYINKRKSYVNWLKWYSDKLKRNLVKQNSRNVSKPIIKDNAYGIESTARMYFGNRQPFNLSESAALVGMLSGQIIQPI